jgi:hypothetical protein
MTYPLLVKRLIEHSGTSNVPSVLLLSVTKLATDDEREINPELNVAKQRVERVRAHQERRFLAKIAVDFDPILGRTREPGTAGEDDTRP